MIINFKKSKYEISSAQAMQFFEHCASLTMQMSVVIRLVMLT